MKRSMKRLMKRRTASRKGKGTDAVAEALLAISSTDKVEVERDLVRKISEALPTLRALDLAAILQVVRSMERWAGRSAA